MAHLQCSIGHCETTCGLGKEEGHDRVGGPAVGGGARMVTPPSVAPDELLLLKGSSKFYSADRPNQYDSNLSKSSKTRKAGETGKANRSLRRHDHESWDIGHPPANGTPVGLLVPSPRSQSKEAARRQLPPPPAFAPGPCLPRLLGEAQLWPGQWSPQLWPWRLGSPDDRLLMTSLPLSNQLSESHSEVLVVGASTHESGENATRRITGIICKPCSKPPPPQHAPSPAAPPAAATISAAGPGSAAVPAAAAVISGPGGGGGGGGGGGAGPVSPQHHELTSLFECPVCFDYVLPPILQCQAGHLVCNQCRQKLSCCPTCRGALTPSIRNLAMEKVASAVLFPCKYATTGCSLTLHHTEKPEHEDICEYRPYSCPCPGASCKWQGSLEAVMSHLMHAHKSITTLQGEDIVFLATDINLPGAVDWVMMQSCFGHHFMLVLEKQEKYEGHQQFFAIVLLIGTRKQAENFAYRLELNGNRRRLTWEATPRSIHDGVAAAILNSDCLVFDTAIAHLFADNGNLGINVTISTCCP
eukprot:XP_022264200.1 E3 ubiquitin-protein ligase SIAH2 [Canis lupus familiaris]